MDIRENARRLAQVRYLKGEVNLLSQRIAEMEQAAAEGGRVGKAWEDMRDRLDARRWRCMELLGALYGFIDDIEDSRMRQIMTYRYIYGESWQRVATRIGESDEQYPRRLHNRFLAGAEVPSLEETDGWLRRRQWQRERGLKS